MNRNAIKTKSSKRLKIHPFAIIGVLLAATVLCLLPFAAQPSVKAFGDGGSKFDQATYENVGKVVRESYLPSFLKKSEYAQAIAKEKMQAAYREMTENGFDMGYIAAHGADNDGIRDWDGLGVQEFRGGEHAVELYDRKHGYIIVGSIANGIPAGCLVNNMLVRWTENRSKWGYPLGNQFALDGDSGTLYQNFLGGYATLNPSTGIASFSAGRFLDSSTGQESDSPVAEVETGLTDGTMPAWASGKQTQIKAAFVDAYQKITTTDAVKKGGYRLGVAFEPVTLWMPENLALTQPFTGGDNDGNPYGWGAQGRLVLSDADAVAFPLLGASLTRWAALNGFRVVGYPLSYPFELDGITYQIFSKAYFAIDELGYIENVQLYAGAVSYADQVSIASETGVALAKSNFMAAYKNYNNTGENFGLPADYMRYTDGAFVQPFTATDGSRNYLVQKGAAGSCVMLTGKAAQEFASRGIKKTGAPLGNAFTAGGKTYQNFEEGYVNMTDGGWVKNKNVLRSGSVVKTGTVAIHDDTGVLAEGTTGYNADTVKTEFTEKVRALNAQGTYCYEPTGKVTVVGGSAVQEFVNTASSAKGRLVLSKATRGAPVRVIKDVFYTLYEDRGGFDGMMDVPKDDQFCFGGRVYQNFRDGYATVDSANLVTYTGGQNVSADGVYTDVATGEEINPVPQAVGQYGDISRIPIELRDKQDKVRAAFQAEYARLMKTGFYPGETDTELVHQWAPQTGYTWINQTFRNGDSTAAAFDNNSAMKIFLTDIDKGAFSVYSDMLAAWLKLGSIGKIGYPEGNQFVYNGDLYQNFTGGYIKCPNGLSTSAEFVRDETFVAPEEKGCGAGVTAGSAAGAGLALIAAGLAVVCSRRKKEEA